MAAERAQPILVIGIGNAERGDDGGGLAVAEFAEVRYLPLTTFADLNRHS